MPDFEAIGRCVEAEKEIKRYTLRRAAAIDMLVKHLIQIKSSGENFSFSENMALDEVFEVFSAATERDRSRKVLYSLQKNDMRQMVEEVEEAEAKLMNAVSSYNEWASQSGEEAYKILKPWNI